MTSADKDALLRRALIFLQDSQEQLKLDGRRNQELILRCQHLIIGIAAALAEQSDGWVKCSERLPELHKDYWIYIKGGDFATIARLNQHFDGDFYWCLDNGNKLNDIELEDVTHYAECARKHLPPLPKE